MLIVIYDDILRDDLHVLLFCHLIIFNIKLSKSDIRICIVVALLIFNLILKITLTCLGVT